MFQDPCCRPWVILYCEALEWPSKRNLTPLLPTLPTLPRSSTHQILNVSGPLLLALGGFIVRAT